MTQGAKSSEEHKVGAKANIKAFFQSQEKFKDDEVQKKANSLLWQMICEHCCIIVLQIPFGFLGSINEVAAPYFIGRMVDAFTTKELEQVKGVMAGWVTFIVAGAVLSMIREVITNYASEKLGSELRQKFYEAVIHKGIAFYDNKKTGDICKSYFSLSDAFLFR